ncbi:hypothetical protein [Clostridium sulfidigenes]|uniref:hypothetical protein n=1 Tax=Clostridium sulfidigenes TaxID=318464 RepID=UPI003F8C7E3B
MEDEIINKVNIECKEQFQFEDDIKILIDNDIVPKINEYLHGVKNDKKQLLINKAITFLTCQEIRNYNSSMLLIRNGYATNALVNLRQMVEIILEINFILGDTNKTYERALNYFKDGNKVGKYKKSIYSFNTRLYKAYEVLCNHSHANSNALYKNKNGNIISIGPNDILVKETSILVNSIFYYSLETILKFYNINDTVIEKINVPENVKDEIINYKEEQEITNLTLKAIFKSFEFTDEEILKEKENYKEYLLNRKK